MNQQVTDFNNKGVSFFNHGLLEDALVMFNGSIQLALNDVQQNEGNNHDYGNKETCTGSHHVKQARKRMSTNISHQIENERDEEGQGQIIGYAQHTTALPLLSCLEDMFDSDSQFTTMEKPEQQERALRSTIIVYNTALTYKALSVDKPSFTVKAITLFDKVLDLVAGIAQGSNSKYALFLVIAAYTNMMHIHEKSGSTDLAKRYHDQLCYIIGTLWYGIHNTCQDQREEDEEITCEIKRLVSTFVLLDYDGTAGAAAAA